MENRVSFKRDADARWTKCRIDPDRACNHLTARIFCVAGKFDIEWIVFEITAWSNVRHGGA